MQRHVGSAADAELVLRECRYMRVHACFRPEILSWPAEKKMPKISMRHAWLLSVLECIAV